jgi:threonyl-tRNA synthetase
VHLDGVLPQRLEASYVAPDGGRAMPLMIHHAISGSLGRMIAIMLEHHGGVLPFWLSPDQVAVASISKEHAEYGANMLAAFEEAAPLPMAPIPCRGASWRRTKWRCR